MSYFEIFCVIFPINLTSVCVCIFRMAAESKDERTRLSARISIGQRVSHKASCLYGVVFVAVESRTSARVTANLSKRFAHCLFVCATGDAARRGAARRLCILARRTTDVAIHGKTFRGIPLRSGSRVDQISPVIYSMRVGDVPPSFVVEFWPCCATEALGMRVKREWNEG